MLLKVELKCSIYLLICPRTRVSNSINPLYEERDNCVSFFSSFGLRFIVCLPRLFRAASHVAEVFPSLPSSWM
jgi:hypothetical protein